ncbi:MAG: hypothetical protein AAGJ35_12205 [Myxococcota bacterium]
MARSLLEMRPQWFGSIFVDFYRNAALLLQTHGHESALVVALAKNETEKPEWFLDAAKDAMSAGRFEASAYLALSALYIVSMEDYWFPDAYKILQEAAKKAGQPKMALVVTGDDVEELTQYQLSVART